MDAERPQRVDHRVRHGRHGAGRAGFARAFYPERITGRGDRAVVQPNIGDTVRAGYFVIHEGAGEKLPGYRVVDRAPAHHLPDSLRDAAVQLAVEQDVIDDPAAVVHRGVVQDLDGAGFGIDLDLGHVRAAGKGARQRDLAAGVEGAAVFLRQVLESDREIGAFHAVAALREFQIVRRDLQVFCRELGPLAHRLARRDQQHSAVRHHRARADRALAHQARPVRIARPQRDFLRIHSERFTDDLRIHRLVPLSGWAGKDIEKRIAGFAELDHRLLLGRAAGSRGLDEYGAADAAHFSAALRLRAPRGE